MTERRSQGAPQDLPERITAYLAGGGLFNPELANHDAVRDLLIECRAALAARQEAVPPEALRLAHVAVRECPQDQLFMCDWMEAAMAVCRMLAAAPPAQQAAPERDFALTRFPEVYGVAQQAAAVEGEANA